MAVANHEGSQLDFPGLDGIFDPNHVKVTAGWLGSELPYSGVMAEAVQSVAITSRVAAENLLAIAHKGHAGYSKRYGGVDVTIDAVLTDNAGTSGAYGYQLSDFDNKLPSGLVLYTTNGVIGKGITVTGLYVNSISFNFNANDNSTTSWGFVGDGIIYSGFRPAVDGSKGYQDYHCVKPLTWDEVHILDSCNNVLLTGVQSATFAATINRNDIFQIGQFEPYDRSVVYPYNVSVTLNTLANDVSLVNWWDKFVPTYDPSTECDTACGGLIIKIMTNNNASHGSSLPRELVVASGLRPTTSTLNAAVGSNTTVALTFEGTSLKF